MDDYELKSISTFSLCDNCNVQYTPCIVTVKHNRFKLKSSNLLVLFTFEVLIIFKCELDALCN
jgi:hypothetical protein